MRTEDLMNTLIRRFCVPALFFIAGGGIYAQNAKEDFERVNKAYKEIPTVSMDIVYTVYPNHYTDASIDRQQGTYKKEKEKFYSSLMGAETIVRDSKMLTIHKEQKSITLSPAKPLYGFDASGMKLDELLKVYKKIDFINKSQNEKGYVVYFKDGSNVLSKFEFYFNAETYLITKMKLYYNRNMEFSADGKGNPDKPRLEISFSNINTHPKFNKEDFDLEKYVVFGKKAKLNSTYQHYRFIESKI
jgi:hypothetical protein